MVQRMHHRQKQAKGELGDADRCSRAPGRSLWFGGSSFHVGCGPKGGNTRKDLVLSCRTLPRGRSKGTSISTGTRLSLPGSLAMFLRPGPQVFPRSMGRHQTCYPTCTPCPSCPSSLGHWPRSADLECLGRDPPTSVMGQKPAVCPLSTLLSSRNSTSPAQRGRAPHRPHLCPGSRRGLCFRSGPCRLPVPCSQGLP